MTNKLIFYLSQSKLTKTKDMGPKFHAVVFIEIKPPLVTIRRCEKILQDQSYEFIYLVLINPNI